MSRFLSGALIVLFVVVVSLVAGTVSALFEEDTAPAGASFTKCTTTDDATTCHDVGKGSFLKEVFGATIMPFNGDGSTLAGFLNAVWLLVMGFLLVAGVLLIVSSFIPLLSA